MPPDWSVPGAGSSTEGTGGGSPLGRTSRVGFRVLPPQEAAWPFVDVVPSSRAGRRVLSWPSVTGNSQEATGIGVAAEDASGAESWPRLGLSPHPHQAQVRVALRRLGPSSRHPRAECSCSKARGCPPHCAQHGGPLLLGRLWALGRHINYSRCWRFHSICPLLDVISLRQWVLQ